MTTANDFALVTDKKLLGFKDFDLYLLKYLRGCVFEATKRLFAQGSFEERMPLSSPGNGQIRVDIKPTIQDFFAHDGAGHFLNLSINNEANDTITDFANVTGQLYEVGAQYIEYPVEIRTNPRTGKFEYDHMREGVGVSATPDTMVVDTAAITFVVDALFEQGVTVANHTGRLVRVFPIIPGDLASSEAVSIETCTVFYDGQNKITTTSLLGQSVALNSTTFYSVQLIGLTVLMDTATNAPSRLPESVFFIGTVEGNGATPTVFDVTGQRVIQAQSADMITVDPLPDWADATTNPGGFLQAVLEKMITDLATSGGAAKIMAPTMPAWADSTTVIGTTVAAVLANIVNDLAQIGGDGSIAGSQKVSALDLGTWADGTPTGPGTVHSKLADIFGALTSITDQRGAGKITAPALPDWADGTTNPAARVDEALAKIVTDLTSVTDTGGTGKIAGVGFDGDPYSLSAGVLLFQLGGLLGNLNEVAVFNDRRAEFAAIRNVSRVYVDAGGGVMRDVAAKFAGDNPNDYIEDMVAVGDGNTLARFSPGQSWLSVTPAASFSAGFTAVAYGRHFDAFVMVGNVGEIQSFDGAVTRRKNGGNNFRDVAYLNGTYCAVGDSGYIWTCDDTVNLNNWIQRTGAAGMTTDTYVSIETDGNQFVVLAGNNTGGTAKVMTSPDGVTWTAQPGANINGAWLTRQLQYSPRTGFVALRVTASDIGISYSDDGVNWTHQGYVTPSAVIDEGTYCVCIMDRQIAFLHGGVASFFNAIIAEAPVTNTPTTTVSGYQNIFNIADCSVAGAKNVKGTVYVFGRNAAGDAVILTGPPIRPNGVHGV